MIPTTYLQLTDIDSRYLLNIRESVRYANDTKTVRWRRLMDGHSLYKRHQDRTMATSNGRTNDIKTVRWRRLMDGHSLCKRHKDRTVATSNVNASIAITSTQSGYVLQNCFGKTSGTFRRGLRRILHFRETETV